MRFSIEVDKYNPTALTWCLNKLEKAIPNYEYEWSITINAGGIDYGIFLNIDTDEHEIEICNQPAGEGDDTIDDVIDYINETYEEE